MGRLPRTLACLALAGALASCTTFDVEGDGVKTPDAPHGTATRHGSFWGIEWSDWTADTCGTGNGLYRVRFHTNALYALATVFSVGLYVPQDVEWWCSPLAPAAGADDSGSSDPADLFGPAPR